MYCHHPHLAVFEGRLYAMWSTGPRDEDSAGQHVVYTRSADGVRWDAVRVLAADPDGPDGTLRLTAGGWHSHQGRLVAYYTTFSGSAGQDKWGPPLRLEARTSTDGIAWGAPRAVLEEYLANDGPRPMSNGFLLMTGENRKGRPRLMWTADPSGLAGWREGDLPIGDGTIPPNEPTWFERAGSHITMVFRDDNGSAKLFAAVSCNQGRNWSRPRVTGFPDARAKTCGGVLPDGRAYIIGNPDERHLRNPLVLSLAGDARTFDRAYIIRDEPTEVRYEGRYKGPGYQYPDSVIWGDRLCIVYSVNKEDVAVSLIPIEAIR